MKAKTGFALQPSAPWRPLTERPAWMARGVHELEISHDGVEWRRGVRDPAAVRLASSWMSGLYRSRPVSAARIVCGSQPVAATSSARVAPSSSRRAAFRFYSRNSSTICLAWNRRLQVRVLLVDDDAAIARSIEPQAGIEATDAGSADARPDFYGINCSHPLEFEPALEAGDWIKRIRS